LEEHYRVVFDFSQKAFQWWFSCIGFAPLGVGLAHTFIGRQGTLVVSQAVLRVSYDRVCLDVAGASVLVGWIRILAGQIGLSRPNLLSRCWPRHRFPSHALRRTSGRVLY